MTLAAGTRLGPYEILRLLGAGGMGEVYRAKDTRLGRDVAIKVLPEEFFEDEERRQRFEREARMLASLNHPGIAAIYSFEEIPGPRPLRRATFSSWSWSRARTSRRGSSPALFPSKNLSLTRDRSPRRWRRRTRRGSSTGT